MLHQATIHPDFDSWRDVARKMLAVNVPPDELIWVEQSADAILPGFASITSPAITDTRVRVPKAFVDVARLVSCYRDPQRWTLLYRVLWRLTHGEPHLMAVAVDNDIYRLLMMHKAVRRDRHPS